MKIPEHVRDEVQDWLWREADRLGWLNLSAVEKSQFYSNWTSSEKVGGRLGAFMDPRKVRVYLKDTLLKTYTIERMSDHTRAFRVLGLPHDMAVFETYIKPHGRRIGDGKVIAWSNASEWKLTIMAVFERAFVNSTYRAHAAILLQSSGRFADPSSRCLVESAAKKLGLERLIWLD